MTTPDERPNTNRWCRYAVLLCLVAQFVLACDTSHRLTPTHDEYWHLPIGLLIWKTGRFDCDVINPPLLRLWAALPLVLGGATLDADATMVQAGEIGDLFWMSNPENRMQWFAYGRVMIAVINVGTGWILSRWGRRWFGDIASLAVTVLWCGCPNILAHGSLVTHDAAATFGFVSTLYAIVCWCERPSWRRAVVAGVCLGVAQLLKVTCVILFPLSIIVWILLTCRMGDEASHEGTEKRPTWKTWAGQWLIVTLLAIFVLNAGYLGQQTCQPLRSIAVSSKRFQGLQQVTWLNLVPIPVPKFHVQALDRVALDLQNSHQVYLDSEWDDRGFRIYYFKALLYKLPLGVWLMLALTTLHYWAHRKTNGSTTSTGRSLFWRRQWVLLSPILMLVVPASMGSNQFGIRYILPILPLLYLIASQAAIPLAVERWRLPHWLVVAALVSEPFSLRYHPHHLAYFNEWSGGPDAKKKSLIDSNLDWGQDLHGLANYLREKKIDKIGLAYFGTVHPQSLGIHYALPPTWIPRPGDYAISVNFLEARPFVIRTPTSHPTEPITTIETLINSTSVTTTQDDEFRYFRFFEPQARIGHSIYVYHLTANDVARYVTEFNRTRSL